MAPGGTDINSIYFDGVDDDVIAPSRLDRYELSIGTSFAAPHVAAIAALMKELDPSLDNASFMRALERGELTEQGMPEQFYGAGLINAQKAVYAAGADSLNELEVFPSNLSFGNYASSASLFIGNAGSDDLTIELISANVPWLDISLDSVDAQGASRYVITVDPDQVSDQAQQAMIEVEYRLDGGVLLNETVPVFKAAADVAGQLSRVYVYLLRKQEVNAAAGSYDIYRAQRFDDVNATANFQFFDVPEGEYYLEASTDSDGDARLFDKGEAVGAY
ncbi:S8 family serine peptidase, partial [Oleiphilus sp. HI0125]